MKLVIASDIHGSKYYCEALLQQYEKEKADKLILLGDLLYHGPRNDLPKEYNPKAVIELLNKYKNEILCVRGNCEAEVDQMVLEFPVLADYSTMLEHGKMFFFTHGHLYNKEKLPPIKQGDYLIHGHTHIIANEEIEGIRYLNPGSVSIAKGGNPNSYLVYEHGLFIWKKLDGTELARHNMFDIEKEESDTQEKEKSHTLEESFLRLVDIIATLRSENGCPWDKKQTHKSLETCMIEEAYELVEGIEIYEQTKDKENLVEELGDVLLQVLLHSQIGKEEKKFTIEDVIKRLSTKMIHRHPFVFGDTKVENPEEALKSWESLKQMEKKETKTPLKEIPTSFPALLRGQKVWRKSEKIYGDEKTKEECLKRIKDSILDNKIEDFTKEEQEMFVTNLLIAIVNLGNRWGINCEHLLSMAITKKIEEKEGK